MMVDSNGGFMLILLFNYFVFSFRYIKGNSGALKSKVNRLTHKIIYTAIYKKREHKSAYILVEMLLKIL